MSAAKQICDTLWPYDVQREGSTDLVYCGRCEAEGGAWGVHTAHWSEVPHEKDCVYAIALAATDEAALARAQATAEERERCAKIAEKAGLEYGRTIAAAIRTGDDNG